MGDEGGIVQQQTAAQELASFDPPSNSRLPPDLVVLVAWFAVWFAYFVLLKRSRFRTLGYIMARARIVNLQGERPSISSLIIRFLFAIFGPLTLLFDLFWILSDPARQALRDKFAHTCSFVPRSHEE